MNNIKYVDFSVKFISLSRHSDNIVTKNTNKGGNLNIIF